MRLNEHAYLAALRAGGRPLLRQARSGTSRGSSSRPPTTSSPRTTSAQLVRDQLQAFCRDWRQVNLAYARSKNLTPYDVLKIASMIEEEAAVPARAAADRGRDLQPAARRGCRSGSTRRSATGSTSRRRSRSPRASSQSTNPYNTRKLFGLPPTPIANPGLASIEAAAHPAHVDYLYYVRKPDTDHHFFTASASAFDQYLATHGYRSHRDDHVALLGHPVAHSLSPRMQNAAFAARAARLALLGVRRRGPGRGGRGAAASSASPAPT